MIADVIDNDSWRIWPQGREELMLDKQIYRNLESVDDAALERVKQAYERVADMVGVFPVMRPGMVAAIADSPDEVERVNEVVKALGQLGLPTVRHVADPASMPGYVLQLAQQLEASFARLILVAVGQSDLLQTMLEACSSAPVLDGQADTAQLTMQCAKLLGLEDTVLYGRDAAHAGQRAIVGSARRRFAAAVGSAGGSNAWLVSGFRDGRTSRCATTSCSASRNGLGANPPSSSFTPLTRNGASTAVISRAAII